jgi:hypothetical protein
VHGPRRWCMAIIIAASEPPHVHTRYVRRCAPDDDRQHGVLGLLGTDCPLLYAHPRLARGPRQLSRQREGRRSEQHPAGASRRRQCSTSRTFCWSRASTWPAWPVAGSIATAVGSLTAGWITGALQTTAMQPVSTYRVIVAGYAARDLIGRGLTRVIITLGASGALLATGQGIELVPGVQLARKTRRAPATHSSAVSRYFSPRDSTSTKRSRANLHAALSAAGRGHTEIVRQPPGLRSRVERAIHCVVMTDRYKNA